MKCERCHQNDATVHISQVVNGKKSEHYLCQACAGESAIDAPFQNVYSPFVNGGFLSGSIFNPTGGIPAFGGNPSGTSRDLVCPNCGTTFEGFRKSGLFGCSQCYDAFREKLDPMLRRVQGSTRHIGRPVCRTEESKEQLALKERLADLRKRLAAAVDREAYEEAARLRDEVHAAEARLCDLAGPGSNGMGGTGTAGGDADASKGRTNGDADIGKGKGAAT